MFHKITHESIRNTLRNVKSGFNNGYHHIKNIAGHINHGIHVAKHIYTAIEPAIREFAPQHHNAIHGHAMHALNGYENIRNKALDVNHHAENIKGKLSGLI